MKGCTLIEDHARFEAPDRLRVGDDLLTAPRIFINIGGRPSVPPLPGVDDVPFLTNRTILELDRAAGAPGGRGRQLRRPRVRPDAPALRGKGHGRREVASADGARGRRDLRSDPGHPRARGRHRAHLRRVHSPRAARSSCVAVSSSARRARARPSGSHLLLAVGRRPNTDDLGLDAAGVRPTRAGTSPSTTPWARTWPASGRSATATGSGAFTHTAYNDFDIVAANLLDGERAHASDRITAYALYTDPPLGRVGLRPRRKRVRPGSACWSAGAR